MSAEAAHEVSSSTAAKQAENMCKSTKTHKACLETSCKRALHVWPSVFKKPCIQKALFAHVPKKPPCQMFGLHVQQGICCQAESHKDFILQECQDKALRTASGNLSHPQMFTRLDKWSCRHMLAVVTAQDCAIM